MFNLNDIIKKFNYKNLVETNVIPDIISLIEKYYPQSLVSKRYPQVVYKTNSQELYDNTVISLVLKQFSDLLPKFKITTKYTSNLPIDLIPKIQVLIQPLIKFWQSYISSIMGPIQYNVDIVHVNIMTTCHIISDNFIFNIRNVTSWKKTIAEDIIKMLCCIAISHKSIHYIGIVLPFQQMIVMIDINGWDSQPLLTLLLRKCITVEERQYLFKNLWFKIERYNIGSHIRDIHSCSLIKNIPYQTFLRDPSDIRGSPMFTEYLKSKNRITRIISEDNIQYFTHSAYIINMCWNTSSFYHLKSLIEDVNYTYDIGGIGTVVHSGSATQQKKLIDINTAKENMLNNVLFVLNNSRGNLIIETPCGEGNEILCSPEDMAIFFQHPSLIPFINRLYLCVDTCHVFVAGYSPIDYIHRFDDKIRKLSLQDSNYTRIKLIHYNDSMDVCGSHLDRHEVPGIGEIDIEDLDAILEYGYKMNIAMIREN